MNLSCFEPLHQNRCLPLTIDGKYFYFEAVKICLGVLFDNCFLPDCWLSCSFRILWELAAAFYLKYFWKTRTLSKCTFEVRLLWWRKPYSFVWSTLIWCLLCCLLVRSIIVGSVFRCTLAVLFSSMLLERSSGEPIDFPVIEVSRLLMKGFRQRAVYYELGMFFWGDWFRVLLYWVNWF